MISRGPKMFRYKIHWKLTWKESGFWPDSFFGVHFLGQ